LIAICVFLQYKKTIYGNKGTTVIRSTKKMWVKWSIAFKILPFGISIFILKYVAHYFEFEVMELNALFTTLVAGTIFFTWFFDQRSTFRLQGK